MKDAQVVDGGLELDGLRVELWRSDMDGRLVVCVTNESGEMQARDLAPFGVPAFRLAVNEDYEAYVIDSDGEAVMS